jgi:hypothetical protein
MQASLGVDPQHRRIRQAEGWASFSVFVISDRDDGVEAVISARQLENDQNVSVPTRHPLDQGPVCLGVKGLHGSAEKSG